MVILIEKYRCRNMNGEGILLGFLRRLMRVLGCSEEDVSSGIGSYTHGEKLVEDEEQLSRLVGPWCIMLTKVR